MIDSFYKNRCYQALKNGKKNFKINYLNPKDEELIAVIGWHEEVDGYMDAGVYKPFIRNEKYWKKIYEIEQWHMKNFIEPFLMKWGYMGSLNRFKKGWKENLLPILKGKTGKELMKFSNLNLCSITKNELKKNRKSIISCFDNISYAIGPTATGKVLHLLHPNFFPLWDRQIRIDIKAAYKKNPTIKICSNIDSGDFYYDFMNIQRNFIIIHNNALKKCGKKCYDKSVLRMADIYFWTMSNKAREHIKF